MMIDSSPSSEQIRVTISRAQNWLLYASKMIMRPEREAEERPDPCPEQRDCRYVGEPLRESEPVSENAAPDQRAEAQKSCDDDYASPPGARLARAIQCGWRPDHRLVYTPGISPPATRSACCARAESQPKCAS